MYFNLMQAGHSMTDIDEMDIFWYLEVMNHRDEDGKIIKEEKDEIIFIDQLNW